MPTTHFKQTAKNIQRKGEKRSGEQKTPLTFPLETKEKKRKEERKTNSMLSFISYLCTAAAAGGKGGSVGVEGPTVIAHPQYQLLVLRHSPLA